MMEAIMTRRSFLLLALIFVLILSVSSVALADATYIYAVEFSPDAPPTTTIQEACLEGGATLASSGKVNTDYIEDEQGIAVFYTINSLLEDSDWQVQDDVNHLRVQTIVRIPQDERIYYYKLSLDSGWESGISAARNPQGQLYGGTGDGYRIDEREFENGDNMRVYTYHWLDADYKEISTTTFTIMVKYPAFPAPVPASRIEPQSGAGGAVYDGSVVYPASETAVSTVVSWPGDLAVNDSIGDGEKQPVPSDGKITLSTAADTEYIINWYNIDGRLLDVETLDVSFFTYATGFEPVPYEWLTEETFEGLRGVNEDHFSVATTTDTDGNINSNVVFKFDLDEADWSNALMETVDTQSVVWPFSVYLPAEDLPVSIMGTGAQTPDIDAFNNLKFAEYVSFWGNQLAQFTEIANVSYDGETAIITPMEFSRSYIFKYMLNNVEHFHRITVEIQHESLNAVKIESVSPDASRVGANADDPLNSTDVLAGDEFTSRYVDGTLIYTINEEQPDGKKVTTSIKKPEGIDAAKVAVYPQDMDPSITTLGSEDEVRITLRADFKSFTMNAFRIHWMDENDNVLKRELLAISTEYSKDGYWMNMHWVPTTGSSVGLIESEGVSPHLRESEPGLWMFDVVNDQASNLDLDKLSAGDSLLYITPPEGATHYRIARWHSALYNTTTGNQTTQYINNSADIIPIAELPDDYASYALVYQEIDGKPRLLVDFGRIINKTTLKDTELSIYTVNETLAGYSDSIIIQWYTVDESGSVPEFNRIDFHADGSVCSDANPKQDGEYLRHGQYIHLIKKPYMQKIDETNVLTEEPTGPVLKATAVVKDGNSEWHNKELKCEIPLQEQDGGEYTYSYMKLTLWDENGNEVKLDPGTKLTIYIPYPDGITHQDVNANKYEFKVIHYLDDNHTRSEELKLRAEGPKGLAFDTTSLSPFLIGYKAVETSDDGNGGSGSGNSGGSSSSGSGSKLPSVVTPSSAKNVEVPLGSTASMSISASRASNYQWYIDRNDGKGFVAIPGANDSSYTTSPVEAKNSGYRYFCRISNSHGSDDSPIFTLSIIGMEIPKTGDMSLLFPALLFAGTALLGRRNKKTK